MSHDATTEPTKRIEVMLSGRVQGVGFRHFTRRNAQELGLSGWVRNVANGNVQVVAEGPKDDLNTFLKRLRSGPSAATVVNADVRWDEAEGEFGRFEVKATSYL